MAHTFQQLNKEGYSIVNNLYTAEELLQLQELFSKTPSKEVNFRQGKDLFAIRHVTEVYPNLWDLIWNHRLQSFFGQFPQPYRLIKSLYFDKPPQSNWFVLWHQDLTISVQERVEETGFINWTNKNGIIGVQPPVHYLEDIITVRIHLDDCTLANGGLKVLPQSHKTGVLSPTANAQYQQDHIAVECQVQAGGVLFMKPLLLHASSRNRSNQHRKVLHLEFSSLDLPENLTFREEHFCG